MRVIGIDPGTTGALVCIDTDLDRVDFFEVPTAKIKGKNQILDAMLARHFEALLPADLCAIEQVHSMPGQGVASMFTFGVSYGLVRGIAAASSVPVKLVTPNTWKSKMGLVGKEKEAVLPLACQLYPRYANFLSRKKDIGKADALMIAHVFAKGMIT